MGSLLAAEHPTRPPAAAATPPAPPALAARLALPARSRRAPPPPTGGAARTGASLARTDDDLTAAPAAAATADSQQLWLRVLQVLNCYDFIANHETYFNPTGERNEISYFDVYSECERKSELMKTSDWFGFTVDDVDGGAAYACMPLRSCSKDASGFVTTCTKTFDTACGSGWQKYAYPFYTPFCYQCDTQTWRDTYSTIEEGCTRCGPGGTTFGPGAASRTECFNYARKAPGQETPAVTISTLSSKSVGHGSSGAVPSAHASACALLVLAAAMAATACCQVAH